jgi:protein-S-isoprenylcysteine O-methyltransferase Ste14
METFGKPTLHPIIFYTGKVAGYVVWFVFIGCAFDLKNCCNNTWQFWQYLAIVFNAAGWLIATISLIQLGKSTRFGLPTNETTLKSRGIYQYSRNPMYTGFGLLTLSGMFFTANNPLCI